VVATCGLKLLNTVKLKLFRTEVRYLRLLHQHFIGRWRSRLGGEEVGEAVLAIAETFMERLWSARE
jgi:hypothetical protein